MFCEEEQRVTRWVILLTCPVATSPSLLSQKLRKTFLCNRLVWLAGTKKNVRNHHQAFYIFQLLISSSCFSFVYCFEIFPGPLMWSKLNLLFDFSLTLFLARTGVGSFLCCDWLNQQPPRFQKKFTFQFFKPTVINAFLFYFIDRVFAFENQRLLTFLSGALTN